MLVDVFSQGHHRQGRGSGARQGGHHRQQERDSVRPESADGRQRHPRRHAGRSPAAACASPRWTCVARVHRARAGDARRRRGAGTSEGGSRGPVPEVPALPRGVGGRAESDSGRGRLRAVRPSSRRGALAASLDASRRVRRSSRWRRPSRTSSTTAASCSPKRAPAPARRSRISCPAILSRQRVLVSTGTKNLQEQIFFKDLPVLQATLGRPVHRHVHEGARRTISACTGSTRLKDGPGDPRAATSASPSRRIDEWSRRNRDRRSRRDGRPARRPARSGPTSPRPRRTASAPTAPASTTASSPKMRQRAAEADVVIVNHHLLCADAAVRQSAFGEVIPSCRYAIVDEAHQLEDVATQYFGRIGQQLPLRRLRARRRPRVVRAAGRGPRLGRTRSGDDVENVRDYARLFFGALQMLRFEGGTDAPRQGSTQSDSRIRVRPAQLERAIPDATALRRRARGTRSDDRPDQGRARGRPRARRAAPQNCESDVRFLTRADDPGHVYYLDIRGRGVFLRASPIDVSDVVREMLLERMTATVLTSATLSVDGRFDYLRGRLGIRHAHEVAAAVRVRLPRSRRSSICRRRCPTRGRRTSSRRPSREVVEILRRTDGRAFVLFTSYSNLRAGPPARVGARSVSDPGPGQRRRGRRCCASSRPRRTPSSSPPPASGRGWTWSANP